MVVDDLHVEGVALLPPETDSPLVVHSDTPLALPITVQFFELITRRNSQVLESFGCVQEFQFSLHPALKIAWKSSGAFTTENLLGPSVREAPDHVGILTPPVNNLKR